MTPPRPYRQITVRFQPDLFEELVQAADQEQRSIAGLLRVIATRYVKDQSAASSRQRGARPAR